MNRRSSIHARVVVCFTGLVAGCAQRPSATAYPEQISYRQDGELIVSTPAGISVHDGQLRRTEGSISLDRQVGGVLKDEPFTFALSDDGQVAAVGFSNTVDRDVVIYDLATRSERTVLDLELPSAPVQGVALDPTGAHVFVRADHGGMFDTETGERLWSASWRELQAPLFSRDGQVLFSFQGPLLEARQALTGELLFSVDASALGGGVGTLTHSGIDGVLVGTRGSAASLDRSGGPGQAYAFWSERDGSVVKAVPQFPDKTFVTQTTNGSALACSPSGDVCASAVALPQEPVLALGDSVPAIPPPVYSVLLWSSDGTLLQELPTFASALAFSPDGTHLAVAGDGVQLYRVSDGTLQGSRQYTYGSY